MNSFINSFIGKHGTYPNISDEAFAKILNGLKILNFLEKSFILDGFLGSE